MLFPKQFIHDRYQLDTLLSEKLGRKTFLATDLQTQTRVVIKFLLFSVGISWEEVKLFEREAEVLRCLHHKAIPQYIDCFELTLPDAQGFAIVQAWIPAKSLKQHLENGRTFSEAEIQQMAEQLLTILNVIHTHTPPIIHRDIKPSNILLSDRSGNSVGQVYLIDFGSVQTIAAVQDRTFTVTGTYGYMPPEQFSGRTFPSSDLYSLGATIAQLLTGVEPSELPYCHGKLQLEPSQCSENLYRWLAGVLQPNPSQRFGSAQQALEALQTSDICHVERSIFQGNSRVQLIPEQETFRIIITSNPSSNFYIEALELIGEIIASLSALIILFLVARPLLLTIPFVEFLLFLFAIGSLVSLPEDYYWYRIYLLFFNFIGKTEIRREGNSLRIKRTVLGRAMNGSDEYFGSKGRIHFIEGIEVIQWQKALSIVAEDKSKHYSLDAKVIIPSKKEFGYSVISSLNDREAEAIANELGYQLQIPVQQITPS